MDSRKLKSHAGISLLELALAVLLLSGGIAWELSVQFMSLRAAEVAHLDLLITKGVVEYNQERLRNLPFADGELSTGQHNLPRDGTGPIPMLDPVISTEVTTVVQSSTYTVDVLDANRKRLTTHVQWRDPTGRTRDTILITVITPAGLTNPS